MDPRERGRKLAARDKQLENRASSAGTPRTPGRCASVRVLNTRPSDIGIGARSIGRQRLWSGAEPVLRATLRCSPHEGSVGSDDVIAALDPRALDALLRRCIRPKAGQVQHWLGRHAAAFGLAISTHCWATARSRFSDPRWIARRQAPRKGGASLRNSCLMRGSRQPWLRQGEEHPA